MSTTATWLKLEWDSHFFGFGVGRINAVPGTPELLIDNQRRAREAGFRLLYAECEPANVAARSALTNAGAFLADMKRTYAAAVPEAASDGAQTEPVVALPALPPACERRQLRALAWQAAAHSRFKVDPRMPPGSWRRMYSTWIANSLDGSMADRVLATRSGDVINAMATVALRGTRASIGLLAVQQGKRGQGLGRRLVHAAFDAAREAGLRELAVVTQGRNAAACRTYEACGMVVADEQCIFHLWTDK
jgi:dTDP-4-amino-4,6-dideoxy-D-galactose acyltransferase